MSAVFVQNFTFVVNLLFIIIRPNTTKVNFWVKINFLDFKFYPPPGAQL